MRAVTVEQQMAANADQVFDLLHNYDRRLEWDTLLSEARLTRDHEAAEKGATSLCVGKPMFGAIGIETRYMTFERGELAAVKMINKPPFFAEFAASIRHTNNDSGSLATYKFRFKAKPRWLRWALEPIMLFVLRMETRKRMKALSEFLA
jgi:hypothetical protein